MSPHWVAGNGQFAVFLPDTEIEGKGDDDARELLGQKCFMSDVLSLYGHMWSLSTKDDQMEDKHNCQLLEVGFS